MWLFFLFAAALTALALLFVLPVLLRAAPASTSPQLAGTPQPPRAVRSAALIGLALPLGAAVVYALQGQPQTLTAPAALRAEAPSSTAIDNASASDSVTPERINAMVQRLAERLKTQPDDVAGWRMLARSYETQGRFDQAVEAHRQLARLLPRDAGVLADQAVALGMSRDQHLSGEPEKLLQQALALEPDHAQALALLGSAAFERADYPHAIALWQRILSRLPADDEMAVSIAQSIDKARTLAAQARPASR